MLEATTDAMATLGVKTVCDSANKNRDDTEDQVGAANGECLLLLVEIATIDALATIRPVKGFFRCGSSATTVALGLALLEGTFDFLHSLGGNFWFVHDVIRQILYQYCFAAT
ncbi:MAG: hypothetical protein JWM78_1893 [Verrucomicrobiaceae bacterium]|nr:hypothetical protein [Verrucomicrobiaceae bacterium]